MASLNEFYRKVMEDVIQNIKAEIDTEHLDADTLDYLAQYWEHNLISSGNYQSEEHPEHSRPQDQRDSQHHGMQLQQQQYIGGGPDQKGSLAHISHEYGYLPVSHSVPLHSSNPPYPRQLNPPTATSSSVPGSAYLPPTGYHSLNSSAKTTQTIPQKPQANTSANQTDTAQRGESKKITQVDGDGDDDDDSDDNLSGLSDSSDEEIADYDTIVCKHEKVKHNKSKWRCEFKEGIMRLNGREYMFMKATGTFDWNK